MADRKKDAAAEAAVAAAARAVKVEGEPVLTAAAQKLIDEGGGHIVPGSIEYTLAPLLADLPMRREKGVEHRVRFDPADVVAVSYFEQIEVPCVVREDVQNDAGDWVTTDVVVMMPQTEANWQMYMDAGGPGGRLGTHKVSGIRVDEVYLTGLANPILVNLAFGSIVEFDAWIESGFQV